MLRSRPAGQRPFYGHHRVAVRSESPPATQKALQTRGFFVGADGWLDRRGVRVKLWVTLLQDLSARGE